MFDNLLILSHQLKQPLKCITSSMDFDDFIEFCTEYIERSDKTQNIEYSYDHNNTESTGEFWSMFSALIRNLNTGDALSEVRYNSIYPCFGTIIAIPNFETNTVKILLIYGVEDFWENEVCEDCFQSLFLENTEIPEEIKAATNDLISNYPIIQHDQSKDSPFRTSQCDCCGSHLHGKRYFLVCMKDTK